MRFSVPARKTNILIHKKKRTQNINLEKLPLSSTKFDEKILLRLFFSFVLNTDQLFARGMPQLLTRQFA